MLHTLSYLIIPSEYPISQEAIREYFNQEDQDNNATSMTSPSQSDANKEIVDINIFRSGIAPIWEDSHNVGGGRWYLRMRKGVSDRIFEAIVFALCGNRFSTPEAASRVNGIVLSVRKDEDILSLWCSPGPRADRDLIRASLVSTIEPLLTPTSLANLSIDYKSHPMMRPGSGSTNGLTSGSLNSNNLSSSAASTGHHHGRQDHSNHHHHHHHHRLHNQHHGSTKGQGHGPSGYGSQQSGFKSGPGSHKYKTDRPAHSKYKSNFTSSFDRDSYTGS